MVAATMAASATRPLPSRGSADADDQQMPAMPATTPNSFRGVAASWRVTTAVSRKVKIGAAELRMVASAAST